MKRNNFAAKKASATKEQKLQRNMLAIIIVLVIINIAPDFFFYTKIIGHNTNYTIYFFLLPVIIGVVVLGYFRRHFLLTKYAVFPGLLGKLFITVYFLLQGLFFSYLTFGFVSNQVWVF